MRAKLPRTCFAFAAVALAGFVWAGCVKMESASPQASPAPPPAASKPPPKEAKEPGPAAKMAAKTAQPTPAQAAVKKAQPAPHRLAANVAAAKAAAPTAPVDGKAPKAHVAEPTADLGDIKRGETGKHTFVIKNTGKDVLTIKRAKGT
jgi:hypothetical protein